MQSTEHPSGARQVVRRRRLVFLLPIVAGILLGISPPAEADLIRGVGKIIGGVLQLPLSTLAGTFNGPPLVGTLLGAVNGTINAVGMVLGGTLELAGDGLALAKMAAPYVLPFVF
ncbi:MAG: hypothetical protein HYY58_00895 [Candidatus Omnitrophica bacterium]|nr:hypothetical protein [Candidatus Omnitrophota bacterium]